MKKRIYILLLILITSILICMKIYEGYFQMKAFQMLESADEKQQRLSYGVECALTRQCFIDYLSQVQKRQIASWYGIEKFSTSENSNIKLSLEKGSSIYIPGIGTVYERNLKKLDIKMDRWYYEIGSCSTNKRIFVDSITGEHGIVHNYIYCSKVNEPGFPIDYFDRISM